MIMLQAAARSHPTDPLKIGTTLAIASAMLRAQVITPGAFRHAIAVRSLDLKPGNVYTHITQPYFFSYVIDQLEQHYGASTVREGGLQVAAGVHPTLTGDAELPQRALHQPERSLAVPVEQRQVGELNVQVDQPGPVA